MSELYHLAQLCIVYLLCCRFWKQLVNHVKPTSFDWSCDQSEGYLMTSLQVCIVCCATLCVSVHSLCVCLFIVHVW